MERVFQSLYSYYIVYSVLPDYLDWIKYDKYIGSKT